jgi:flavin-dependent dehydrogenase
MTAQIADVPVPTLFDAAVIGAGPAGATVARLLARWGHSVALIGRAPGRRTIGESLPPSCTKLFDTLGIRDEVDAARFLRATGNTVQWGVGDARVEHFASGIAGYQVQRDAFDALLVACARRERRVTRHDATVLNVARQADATSRVSFESNAGPASFQARWVLDCSGRAGVVARHGMRRAEQAMRTMALVGVWDRVDEWPVLDNTHTLVESYDGGWAWSVPVSATRRYVTFMVDPSLTPVPGRAKLGEAYAAELARTTMLRRTVSGGGASLVDVPWGCDASPYSAHRAFDDGVLLIGDAASFVDPLSSFGVKKALASAWLGAVVVHTSLIDPPMVTTALELFAEREQSMFDGLQRQSALLARDAGGEHETAFWTTRSNAGDDDTFGELDVSALRADPRVHAAFEELKQRPSVALRLSESTRIVERAIVRGNRVVLEPHLATPGLSRGVRYCRNVDLVLLSEVAGGREQVPDLFDAYARIAAPVPLPDFLGALSAAIALGILSLGD